MNMRAACWIALFFSLPAWADNYELFYENGKAGLRDQTGKVILPAAFDALGWSDGHFSVISGVTGYRKNNQWGLLNLKKELVTDALFENLTSTGGDRIIASRWINPYTKKFGCINLAGAVTVPFHYDGIQVRGLRAIVFVKNGARYEYGLIDLDNRSILPLRFRDIRPVGTLRLAVQNFEKKMALFSEEGSQLTAFVIDSISTFKKGRAIVYQDLKQGILNRDGVFEKEPQFREVRIADSGETTVRSFDQWLVLSSDNQVTAKTEADVLMPDQSMFTARVASMYGILNKQLGKAVDFSYRYIGPFANNLAVACKDKCGLINRKGEEVFALQHDSVLLDRNFLRVGNRQFGAWSWAVYDTFGIRKTEKAYEHVGNFNGKFFLVRAKGYTGAVDRYGKELISCVYDSILSHDRETVVVKFKGQYGIVNYEERWLVPPQPYPLLLAGHELYLEKRDSTLFLKTLSGEVVYFSNNMLVPRGSHLEEQTARGEKWNVSWQGISSRIHALAVSEPTERVLDESEGYRGILRDGRYGFIDARGRLRVANRYEAIGPFREGLAPVRILGKWGFVNPDDKIVINPSYDTVTPLREGVSMAWRFGKAGLLHRSGRVLLEFRYDSIYEAGHLFVMVANGKKGLADRNGNVLIEPRFSELQLIRGQRVLVCNDQRWGILSHEGLDIIPTIYDGLTYLPDSDQFLALKRAAWAKLDP
jgi:hypothetical protein